MLAARPFRFIVIALCLAAPALIAQVPSASDPPKYVMPPKIWQPCAGTRLVTDALTTHRHLKRLGHAVAMN